MTQWIKKTLLFFSCFAWTQQLLSLSTLSLWNNINKKTTLKRKNTQSTPNDKRHKTPSKYQCDFNNCNASISGKEAFKRHQKNHSLETNILCFVCSNRYKTFLSFIKHQEARHDPDKFFKCEVCHFTYSDKQKLTKHFNTHTNPSCFFCLSDQTYSSSETLHKHTKEKHAYYQCKNKDCNEAFFLGSLLHLHMEKEHDFTSLPCPKCPQLFHGTLTLYQHRYIKHKKCDKNTFIEFLKDFIEKNLDCSYPSYRQHPCFKAIFLERHVLINTLLSNSEIPIGYFEMPIDDSAIPIAESEIIIDDYEMPIFDFKMPIFNFKIPIDDYEIPIFDFKIPIFDYEMPIGDSEIAIDDYEMPIKTVFLYEEFIKNMISENRPTLETLSLDVLLSYECYRLSFFHDSAIELLFLKDILSIMIENRKPLETTYKEMLDILYAKDTNQFSDQAYRLFMKKFEKRFFRRISIAEQIKILQINLLFKKTSA